MSARLLRTEKRFAHQINSIFSEFAFNIFQKESLTPVPSGWQRTAGEQCGPITHFGSLGRRLSAAQL